MHGTVTMNSDSQFGDFEQDLAAVLRQRGAAALPTGMEQRLLARLAQEPVASLLPATRPFSFAESIRTRRSAGSLWLAVGTHAAAILLIAFAFAKHVQLAPPERPAVSTLSLQVPSPPPLLPRADRIGGGGGQRDLSPATEGRLPRFAQQQIVPPKAPPTIPPKLAVEPTVVMQKDLKMADNQMPNLGLPNYNLHGVSLGNGSGTGIGSGNGGGMGPGSGGNTGGGLVHVGGSVRPPAVLYQADPEFSEEARKAKFSGNVVVYLWVDENGNPSHVRVVKGVGMGLDEKAVEAVRQYKFKPAMQNGKPVKVDLNIEVNFQIF